MKQRPTPGELVIVGAAAVLLLASFLDWYTLPAGAALAAPGERSANAWAQGLYPIAVFPAAIGFVLAVEIVLARLADLHLPARIGGVTWRQLRGIGGVFGLAIVVGELATDHGVGSASLDRGTGLWLTLLASLALVGGAAVDRVRAA